MPEATRHDWSLEEIKAIHDIPLTDLVFRAAAVHREHHQAHEVQVCQLVSIKTGACPEDCSYCSQSAHYNTGVDAQPMMQTSEVMEIARRAKERGVSRLCLGAAWREVRDNTQFERVLEMVRGVSGMGMEVCCTLGMLNESQARRLEEAGLHAYNHNLDTSAEHYSKVITTRTQEDRLRTLTEVRKTRVTLCTGGILGLGERIEDRLNLLRTLSSLRPHPESVPINMLSHVEGTPLEGQPVVPVEDLVRVIATARLLMPRSVVRLSAGRARLSTAEQALCFLAGANSIFSSETGNMLTSAVPSPDHDADLGMMDRLGMKPRAPFSGSDTRLKQEHAGAAMKTS